MTQQKVSLWLALYIGWFMNVAVLFRRLDGYAQEFTLWKGLSGIVELVATVLVTFFLLRVLSLLGRRVWRILATLVVIFSAAASYYMTFLNVVIGYGIIASVMTTDIDLSQEVVGWYLILWLALVSAPPLLLIWSNRCQHTLLRQIRTPGQRVKNIAIVALAGLMVWGPIRLLELRQKDVERSSEVDMPSYGGVIANSYLPSNWLSALGLYAWAQVDESSDNKSLINPAKNSPMLSRRAWMIPTWCSLSVKPPAGTIWGSWVITAIPRRSWRRRKTWWPSAATPAIPRPNSLCAACLCVRAGRKTTRSER
jgi:KDO II ethanolaminephosphotransferase